ncbi:MAG TPA: hypothetical protein ENI61_00685 [Ignavibacteria bacterium]|nr:hypothetical protein [Ignavibacteria bacterium]
MVAQYIAPLNLEFILVNLLAGSREIFMGLFFIAISVLAGILKMQKQIFVVMIGLSGILLYGWFGKGFYILILLIAGMVVFYNVSKIVKN